MITTRKCMLAAAASEEAENLETTALPPRQKLKPTYRARRGRWRR